MTCDAVLTSSPIRLYRSHIFQEEQLTIVRCDADDRNALVHDVLNAISATFAMTKPATLRIRGPKANKTTELRTRHCRPKMSLSQTKAYPEFLYATLPGPTPLPDTNIGLGPPAG